jgi:aminomethyltransferase
VSLLRTPLYNAHIKRGAKIVPFAGWELPVQFSGVIQEHNAVRSSAGVFDVSHMGEILVEGSAAESFLQHVTCNNVAALVDGKAQYSAVLNEQGGVIDDIIIYRRAQDRFLVCANASNVDAVFAWFKVHEQSCCDLKNVSSYYGQIALQGPLAAEVIKKIKEFETAAALPNFRFTELPYHGGQVICARTGYTGEDGFEFFVPAELTERLWDELLEHKEVSPIGLGARDSLRLEAAYPLHGHELAPNILALESGLAWIIKFDKGDFVGKAALLSAKEAGIKRSLAGFFVEDAGIARHGDLIVDETDNTIGIVTSGTKTPTVNRALGLALVPSAYAAKGGRFLVKVRDRLLQSTVVATPFYSSLKRSKA